MSKPPVVSVLMPVYNAQSHLAAAVESILAQTMADLELVAVDDGSSDTSLAILEGFARHDARVRILSRPNTGIVGALNDGLALVRGEFIARMDADDITLPRRLETQLAYLRTWPQCVAVGSAVLQIDPDGDPICIQHWAQSHEEIDRLLLSGGGGLAHPTAMIRAAAMRQIGGYREEFQWIEDKDLWLRLAEVGRLANLAEPLLLYRLHENSVTWQRENEQRRLWERLLMETYRRRGLTQTPPALPPRSKGHPAANRGRAKWIRAAVKGGNYLTAIKHVKKLVREQPLALRTWSTVMRGCLAAVVHVRRRRASIPGKAT